MEVGKEREREWGGRDGWSEWRERGWKEEGEGGTKGGREGEGGGGRGREGEGGEGGREGREGRNNCGVVLVVNMYYYGRKDTEHIIMDNGWLMHNSFTSGRRRSNNIVDDFKALPRDT